MMTDPRMGRLQEGYSSNPLHTSHMAVAAVKALQGCAPDATAEQCGPRSYLDPSAVAALGKHYAAYGASRGGLNGGEAAVGNRTLHDVYLRPWRAMAAAGLRACMPSHNAVLDVPAHASRWLIEDTLRGTFGFEGVALSDCNDIGVINDFRFSTNATDAAAIALRAGVTWDLQCGNDPDHWSYNKLAAALSDGLVDEDTLDSAVEKVLTLKFANGLFDQRKLVSPADIAVVHTFLDNPSHRALARTAAQQAMVLLVNNPLPPTGAPRAVAGACPGFARLSDTVVGTNGPAYRRHLGVASEVACCMLCSSDRACTAYTFEGAELGCYLKNAKNGSGTRRQSGAMSGRRGTANASPALPWKRLPKKIALIGPTAGGNCEESVIGSYSLEGADVVCIDRALTEAGVNFTTSGAIDLRIGSVTEAELSVSDTRAIASAVAAVQDPAAEAAIVVLGDLTGSVCGEWGDRDDLTLQGAQLPLLKAVVAAAEARNANTSAGSPAFAVVAVLTHGRPQSFGPEVGGGGEVLLGKLSALISAWRPGEEFGHALLDLLLGNVSPSGKLPNSWPRTVGHVHSGSSPWLQPVAGKWISNNRGPQDGDGRRYDPYSASNYDPTPLFRFGFGLSYTTFSLSGLVVKPSVGTEGPALWEVAVQLTNTGGMLGAEVMQVYVEDPRGLPFIPYWKRLVAFKRVELAAGASAIVSIPVLRDDVAQYGPDPASGELELTLYPGEYTLSVGTDSETVQLSSAVEVPP